MDVSLINKFCFRSNVMIHENERIVKMCSCLLKPITMTGTTRWILLCVTMTGTRCILLHVTLTGTTRWILLRVTLTGTRWILLRVTMTGTRWILLYVL